MGPKNKTFFVQKRATNKLQLFTIRKHTQNSLVFPLTNKTTKSTKPTMTIQYLPANIAFCSGEITSLALYMGVNSSYTCNCGIF